MCVSCVRELPSRADDKDMIRTVTRDTGSIDDPLTVGREEGGNFVIWSVGNAADTETGEMQEIKVAAARADRIEQDRIILWRDNDCHISVAVRPIVISRSTKRAANEANCALSRA